MANILLDIIEQESNEYKPTIKYNMSEKVKISKDLAKFLSIDENKFYKEHELVKMVFQYIKNNNLFYYGDHFIVDLKLAKLFPENGDCYSKCDKLFKNSTLNKLIKKHYISRSII